MACSDVPTAPETLVSTEHEFAFEVSQYQALLSKIEALSTTIGTVNSSLHAKIDTEIQSLMIKGGNWKQQPQTTLSPLETAWISSIVFVAMWVVGFAIFHENASKLSKYRVFLPRVILFALLAANFGLVVALIFGAPFRGYVYVLYIVWPVQAAMAWEVVFDKARIEEVGKGEKK
jgi:fatty acid desaturase